MQENIKSLSNQIIDIKQHLGEQDRRSQERAEEYQKVQDSILIEARKTNGRITLLERWMYLTIGGLTVVSAIIVPMFLRLF
jgi:hypothetical protein